MFSRNFKFSKPNILFTFSSYVVGLKNKVCDKELVKIVIFTKRVTATH